MTIAFIVVPDGHHTTYAAACFAYLEAHASYRFGGLFTDFTKAWANACTVGAVVIVARPDHIPADHEPRIEVIDVGATPAAPPRNDGPTPRAKRRPSQV